MYYTKGVFGVLNLESLPDEPMVLLDGGIESRYKEDYFFDNSCRSNYHGYLFQYTLSGCGAYESNGKTILMEALFFLFLKSLRSTAAVLFQLTRRQTAFKGACSSYAHD